MQVSQMGDVAMQTAGILARQVSSFRLGSRRNRGAAQNSSFLMMVFALDDIHTVF
jgi:hypothetical protein